MRRSALRALVVAVTAVLVCSSLLVPAAAGASTPTAPPAPVTASPTTEAPPALSVTPDIIRRPNSGQRPNSPGDRGGARQLAVFLAICAAIVLIGVLAFFDGRRHKRRARRTDSGTPTGGDGGRSPRPDRARTG